MTATVWIVVCVFAFVMTLAVIGLFTTLELFEECIDRVLYMGTVNEKEELKNT